jgi:phenylacetate-coenzyme A ligase PaaK-like adenylate-forming protein
MNIKNWGNRILSIKTEIEFNTLAIEAFNYQYNNVNVYNDFCNKINIVTKDISHFTEIPFLPIEFFKTHNVLNKNFKPEVIFKSSGTTGINTSKHYVTDVDIYKQSFVNTFNLFFDNIEDYCILALLPSYLEKGSSSLVYMTNELIRLSNCPDSNFYLNNYKQLSDKLKVLNKNNKKTILLGVSYALLDLAEQYPQDLSNIIIMETGGMKGRRKEMIKDEFHKYLCSAFNVSNIYSEYGMTELLSQSYSKGNGIFNTPPYMKILIRDTYDPFSLLPINTSGGVNVIDLANINSCCFIETMDIGKIFSDKSFTIMGRFDNSDIRGCNLMIE